MRYYIRYELQVEAENEKKLRQKLGLIENQIKIKDKHYIREITDDTWDGKYITDDKLNTMEF